MKRNKLWRRKEDKSEKHTHHTRVPKFLLLFPLTSKKLLLSGCLEVYLAKKLNGISKKKIEENLYLESKKASIFPKNYTILLSQNQYRNNCREQ